MTEASENLRSTSGSFSASTESTASNPHIRKLKLFRLLLELQLSKDNYTEEDEEDFGHNTYPFSTVLQRGTSQGWDEQNFISEILEFEELGYVTLSPMDEDNDNAMPKQLIHEKNYGKVLICLNAEIFQFLLNEYIELIDRMSKLETQWQKQEKAWTTYTRISKAIDEKHQDIEKWYSESSSMKSEWEEALKKAEAELEDKSEKLKERTESIAADKVDSKLEKELKLSGRIGTVMQDMQKDIIQFMGIFIAIFALLGLNIGNAGKWSIRELFYVNLVIISSIATMLLFISVIMQSKGVRICFMFILTLALWTISGIAFFYFPV